MEVCSIPMLLVTANVGSVFEDPLRLLDTWIKEFLNKISILKPQFLALHLQEVGGKTYEKSLEHVQEFVRILCESDELNEYNRINIYLDEDYNSPEHFTALGNLYFVHQSLNTVKIWNFLTHDWELVDGKNIYSGNIEVIATKEKAKFPQHFFPECKWSRKGFLRTRWELNCTVIDLINIHLFHDASNLVSIEQFPSVYCKTRRRALVHTLERFHLDFKNGIAPYFVFGDFNFRCDAAGVIKELTEDLTLHRIQNAKTDSTKVHYRSSDGENVLIVGKKEFNHVEHQTKFKESWLQKFDRELEPLRDILWEYPMTFSPSYPYEEEPELPTSYMSTRCPAWCDRIVMSPSARDLIVDDTFSATDYNIIGENVCMGDHKPVYLSIHLKTLQGIKRYCNCFEHAFNSRKDLSNNKMLLLQEQQEFILTKLNNFNLNNKNCVYYNKKFLEILYECLKLDETNLLKSNKSNHQLQKIENENQYSSPKPIISVTDSDNLNICVCSRITNDINLFIDDENGKICSICKNIIQIASNEPRCTLITKRLMLANNVIVNRIDTHYLNTLQHNLLYNNRSNSSSSSSTNSKTYEPYTPESVESHSPYPEYDEELLSSDLVNISHKNCDDKIVNENKSDNIIEIDNENLVSEIKNKQNTLRGFVSPTVLATKLESLQHQNSVANETDNKKDNNLAKHKCLENCCNII